MSGESYVGEVGDGDSGVEFLGKDMEQQVRSVTGDDGIEETHMDFVPRKKRLFFGAMGDKWNAIFGKVKSETETCEKRKDKN